MYIKSKTFLKETRCPPTKNLQVKTEIKNGLIPR